MSEMRALAVAVIFFVCGVIVAAGITITIVKVFGLGDQSAFFIGMILGIPVGIIAPQIYWRLID